VHADPAADYPAAILALDAEIEVAGPRGRRTIRAADFFVDLLQTSLAADEILTEVRVSATPRTVRVRQDRTEGERLRARRRGGGGRRDGIRIGVTGVAPKAYRAGGGRAGAGRPVGALG
jgi:carbon-monoxide dehydrogenase medium subunit